MDGAQAFTKSSPACLGVGLTLSLSLSLSFAFSLSGFLSGIFTGHPHSQSIPSPSLSCWILNNSTVMAVHTAATTTTTCVSVCRTPRGGRAILRKQIKRKACTRKTVYKENVYAIRHRVRRLRASNQSGGAGGGGGGGEGPNDANGRPSISPSFPSATSCPVPRAQQPAVEYENLRASAIFSSASLPLPGFVLRCSVVFFVTLVALGFPIASETYLSPGASSSAPSTVRFLQALLAGGAGSATVLALLLLRLYFGWGYVGNRLLSASVIYEESGWYDGETWVKSDDVRERDRLIGTQMVQPILKRLQRALLATAAGAALAVVALAGIAKVYGDSANAAPVPVEQLNAPVYRRAFTSREELEAFMENEEKQEEVYGANTPMAPPLSSLPSS